MSFFALQVIIGLLKKIQQYSDLFKILSTWHELIMSTQYCKLLGSKDQTNEVTWFDLLD